MGGSLRRPRGHDARLRSLDGLRIDVAALEVAAEPDSHTGYRAAAYVQITKRVARERQQFDEPLGHVVGEDARVAVRVGRTRERPQAIGPGQPFVVTEITRLTRSAKVPLTAAVVD